MNESTQSVSSMLLSLGGSPAPIITSILQARPASIIFFVSLGTYQDVTRTILPAIMGSLGGIPPHEIVRTPDEQDLGQSTFALLREVPAAMHKMQAAGDWPELVDFTGGTKVMSAAVVWASSRYPCRFSYVGSNTPDARSKGGLGIVIDGNERCLITANPWNELAWFEINDAVALFNAGQYANATRQIKAVAGKVTDPVHKRLINLMGELWDAYTQWDVFNHQRAIGCFKNALIPLKDLAHQGELLIPGLTAFVEGSEECYLRLQGIMRNQRQDLSWELIHDLVANAGRRLHLENKNEDATARLYAAIEKTGKHALKLRHGIDNSKCRPEQLPEHLQAEYTRKYLDAKSKVLKFGLQATFDLLIALQDPIATQYQAVREQLEKLLPLRNDSILGHGTTPISSENCLNLLNLTLALLGLTETDLTHFPAVSPASITQIA